MKRELILIFLVLTLGLFGAWRILGSDSSKSDSPKDTQSERGETRAESHGERSHGHGKEDQVELSPEALKNARLEIAEAAPSRIKSVLPLYGKIVANEEAMAEVMPRFPGIVKSVNKQLGDTVEKGEILAVVESNESLRSYEIRSEISGTITKKEVTLGEYVKGDSPIFVVSDLASVWIDLNVFRQDFRRLKRGQSVEIQLGDGTPPSQSTISYLSPFGAESTQTMLARAVIPNPNGDLRPGLFVAGEVLTAEATVEVAVKVSALQTVKEKSVVFVQEGDDFEARIVQIGVRDGEYAEVISGLEAGAKYAATNSFLLKAELGKEEAAHDH
jgi:membrane fusion protein, heavy metal efflux system